ncbi:MAG TPA: hypothetical protein VMV69_14025 [Pirellulales bacterium]|nr:hypothetical protein [Pirellulales bacterium]
MVSNVAAGGRAKESGCLVEALPAGDVDLARHATPEALAVDAAGVARLLGVSERHMWGLHSSGRLPMPVRLGGQ